MIYIPRLRSFNVYIIITVITVLLITVFFSTRLPSSSTGSRTATAQSISNSLHWNDLLLSDLSYNENRVPLQSKLRTIHNQEFNQKFQSTYSDFFKLLHQLTPEIPRIISEKGVPSCADCEFTEQELKTHITEDQAPALEKLKEIHTKVYQYVSERSLKKQSQNLHEGKGILFIGGDGFTFLSLLSILSLRSFGSTLAIQLVLPSESEYEHQLCTEILPSLNAQCVILTDVFGSLLEDFNIERYQYKSLALLASSFKEVLFLDSDNILITSPDTWFDKDPYKSHGLVLWPDYWKRGTSSWFYDVAGFDIDIMNKVRSGRWPLKTPVKVGQSDKVDYHDLKGTLPNPTTESGAILINKTTHIKTLLLSTFYNAFGPQAFYELLSQGQFGQGDKETYIAAAERSGESFYQVKSQLQRFGVPLPDGQAADDKMFGDWFDNEKEIWIKSTAMGQHDPVSDYEEFMNVVKQNEWNFEKEFNEDNVPIVMVHANHPKLDPLSLTNDGQGTNSKNRHYRLYHDIYKELPKDYKDLPYDFELVQYQRMNLLLCRGLGFSFKYFDTIALSDVCKYIKEHVEFLKSDASVI